MERITIYPCSEFDTNQYDTFLGLSTYSLIMCKNLQRAKPI